MLSCLLLLLQADSLVDGLRSADLESREAAGRVLRKAGVAAIPALRKALADADPEHVARAREVLDLIRKDHAPGELDKLRQALIQAKTVRLRFSAKGGQLDEDKIVPVEVQGWWILGEGNKADIFFEYKRGDYSSVTRCHSDGEEMFPFHCRRPGMVPFKTPLDLRSQLVEALLRDGAYYGGIDAAGIHVRVTGDAFEMRKKDPVDISEARWMDPDPEDPSLSNRFMMTDSWRMKSRLWYSAAGYRILKREVVNEGQSDGACTERGRLVETYDLALDADIPAERFHLHGKKY